MIRLAPLLAADRILDLDRKGKPETLRALCEAVARSGRVSDGEAFRRAIEKREKIMTTGVGEGIAIPHAKASCVRAPVLALGRSIPGVPFNAPDGRDVQVAVMIGAPEKETGAYLQILSRVIALLIDERIRQAILNARDGAAVLSIIASHD